MVIMPLINKLVDNVIKNNRNYINNSINKDDIN